MNRRNLLRLTLALVTSRVGATGLAAPGRRSMKGFELYSWEERGSWKFALLLGTNRLKRPEEIQAAAVTLPDLEQKLGDVARGEFILWGTTETPGLSLPPAETVARVRRQCQALGLQLQIQSQGR